MSGQIYVAFDLGSFSIKGAMAKVNQDKELEILSIKSIKSAEEGTCSNEGLYLCRFEVEKMRFLLIFS